MRHWIKLYTEILRDPKMGRLTDRQFRTCISLFVLAGELDAEGALPATDDIAWHLRLAPAELAEDLAVLAAVNIVEQLATGWLLCHWQVRQGKSPSDAAERVTQRVQAYRSRQRDADVTPAVENRDGTTLQCNEDVTPLQVGVTPLQANETGLDKNRIDKNRIDDEDAPPPAGPVAVTLRAKPRADGQTQRPTRQAHADFGRVCTAYEQTLGLALIPTAADLLWDLLDQDQLPADWVTEAMEIALKAGKCRLDYVSGILGRWRREGKHDKKGHDNGSNGNGSGRRAKPVYDPATDPYDGDAVLRRVLGRGPDEPIPPDDDDN